MQVRDFIEKCPQADSGAALFALYREAMQELGIDRIAYCTIRNGLGPSTALPRFYHSYPDSWVDHYLRSDYMKDDPARAYTLQSRRAFTWENMTNQKPLTKRQQRIMNEGREAGLNDGVSLGFHSPKGEVIGIGLASSILNPGVENFLTQIEVISTHFHFAISTFHDDDTISSTKLSLHEQEILKWLAAGKTDYEIGEILKISEQRVTLHIKTIMRKLDSQSRINVVIKALYCGAIGHKMA